MGYATMLLFRVVPFSLVTDILLLSSFTNNEESNCGLVSNLVTHRWDSFP